MGPQSTTDKAWVALPAFALDDPLFEYVPDPIYYRMHRLLAIRHGGCTAVTGGGVVLLRLPWLQRKIGGDIANVILATIGEVGKPARSKVLLATDTAVQEEDAFQWKTMGQLIAPLYDHWIQPVQQTNCVNCGEGAVHIDTYYGGAAIQIRCVCCGLDVPSEALIRTHSGIELPMLEMRAKLLQTATTQKAQ